MVLMMDIKILSAFSILFLSLMVSNEFLEFLANTVYAAILFIIVLFFYQNRQHFFTTHSSKDNKLLSSTTTTTTTTTTPQQPIKLITKEITIENDGEKNTSTTTSIVTKEQSPGSVRLIQNYSPSQQSESLLSNATIKQLQQKNQELQEQINSQIEKSREDQLKYFNDHNKSQSEIKEQIEVIIKLTEKNEDLLNSIVILNSTIDGNRIKIQEISKDRDSIYTSEQKLLSKLTAFEKKEREYQDNEKQLQKKLSDQKDQYSTLKKEFDEKVKKSTKLENTIQSLESKIIKNLQKQQEKEKERERSSSFSSDTSSTFLSSSPSKSIPIPIKTSNVISELKRNNSNDNVNGLIGGNSSVSPPSSSYLRESSDDSDGQSSSSSSEPKFKSLFNKVKSESSKIVNKAQKGINKHLGSDFFTPTPSSSANTSTTSITSITSASATAAAISSTTTTNSTNITPSSSSSSSSSSILTTNTTVSPPIGNEQQLEVIHDKTKVHNESPVKPLIFFDDLGNDKLLELTTDEQIQTKMTISPRDKDRILNDKEQSLSDLFINSKDNKNNISLSNLDNFLKSEDNNNNVEQNNSDNNNKNSSKLEFSIKDEENKVGLRRAKKKPSPGSNTMMEDVSIGIYPFLREKMNNSDIGLFGVFDGHAGRGAADSASKLFPKEIEKLLEGVNYNLREQHDGGDNNHNQSKLLLNDSFLNVDNQMKDHEYEGCTATVALIWRNDDDQQRYLQVGNVGDSSAFLCRGNEAIELTFDHKANDPSEKQRIKDQGIPVTENQTRINGVAVSRSLGNHFIKEQNIGMISIPHISNRYLLTAQDKFIIIASDGLWDVINGKDAIEKVSSLYDKGSTADSMASCLLETAIQSSLCKDNVTVIVVKL